MKVSDSELHILEHALGLTSGNEQYRNYFFTGEGTEDYPHCEALVKKGLMRKRQNPLNELSIEYIYRVTPTGMRIYKE